MSRSRTLAIGVGALAAGLLAWVFLPASPTSPSASESSGAGWPAGVEAVYALEWDAQERVQLPTGGEPSESSLNWQGKLRIRAREAGELLVSLDALEQYQVTLMSTPLDAPESTWVGVVARALLDERGRIRTLEFTEGADALPQHLLGALVRQLQFVTPEPGSAGQEWQARVVDRFGEADHFWRSTDPRRLERERVRLQYRRLDAVSAEAFARSQQEIEVSAKLRLEPDGLPARFESHAALHLTQPDGATVLHATESLRLELLRRETFSPATVASLRFAPARTTEDAARDSRLSHLQQRIDGLTVEQFLADLEQVNGGTFPDMSRWLWRATGLLQLHPELCEKLVARFEDPSTTLVGRALLLDLLVGAGTPEAQASMRQALDSKAARGPGYGQLLQRFSLVQAPTKESADWLSRKLAGTTDSGERIASAASLGAVSRHIRKNGEPELARQLNGQLRSELERAETPEDRGYLLRALGNVGSEDNRPTLLQALEDPSGTVRDSAVYALRHDASNEATASIIAHVRDPDASVQQTALGVLRGRPLDPDALTRLNAQLSEGALGFGNDHLAVTVLASHLGTDEGVRSTLEAIRARSAADANLQARINSILADNSTP